MGFHQWSSHGAQDALSRNPVSNPQIVDSLAEYDSQQRPELSTTEIRTVSGSEPFTTTYLRKLQDNAANNPKYQQL